MSQPKNAQSMPHTGTRALWSRCSTGVLPPGCDGWPHGGGGSCCCARAAPTAPRFGSDVPTDMRSIAYAGLNRSVSLGDEWVIDGENHQSVPSPTVFRPVPTAPPLASRPLGPYLDVPISSLPFAAHSPSLLHTPSMQEGAVGHVCVEGMYPPAVLVPGEHLMSSYSLDLSAIASITEWPWG